MSSGTLVRGSAWRALRRRHGAVPAVVGPNVGSQPCQAVRRTSSTSPSLSLAQPRASTTFGATQHLRWASSTTSVEDGDTSIAGGGEETVPAAESAWEAILSMVPNPRHTVAGQEPGWVSDAAGSMQAGTVDQINDLIEALDVDLNVEVAVVSLPPDALPEGTDPAEFGVNLFNYWGIGHVDTNNGMLVRYVSVVTVAVLLTVWRFTWLGVHQILWVGDPGTVVVVTGDGMAEALPHMWLSTAVKEFLSPRVRAGRLGFVRGAWQQAQRGLVLTCVRSCAGCVVVSAALQHAHPVRRGDQRGKIRAVDCVRVRA